MSPSRDRSTRGHQAEASARSYLESKGLKCLHANFRCRLGELDLIMRDGSSLVFVEVRYRRDSRFGNGAASVTRSKQHKLIQAARFYLAGRPRLASVPCRFDVVSIAPQQTPGNRPQKTPERSPQEAPRDHELSIDWIRNAFNAD